MRAQRRIVEGIWQLNLAFGKDAQTGQSNLLLVSTYPEAGLFTIPVWIGGVSTSQANFVFHLHLAVAWETKMASLFYPVSSLKMPWKNGRPIRLTASAPPKAASASRLAPFASPIDVLQIEPQARIHPA